MADDGGWRDRMTPEDRREFTSATARFMILHSEVKSVGEAAMLERDVVAPEDPAQARDYFKSLSAHYAKLARLHAEVGDVTARMAAILDNY
ncbi:hypothetical protein [Cellulomonas biazotea]|nr:hypothetical protein [Cellulomonas biazotea]